MPCMPRARRLNRRYLQQRYLSWALIHAYLIPQIADKVPRLSFRRETADRTGLAKPRAGSASRRRTAPRSGATCANQRHAITWRWSCPRPTGRPQVQPVHRGDQVEEGVGRIAVEKITCGVQLLPGPELPGQESRARIRPPASRPILTLVHRVRAAAATCAHCNATLLKTSNAVFSHSSRGSAHGRQSVIPHRA